MRQSRLEPVVVVVGSRRQSIGNETRYASNHRAKITKKLPSYCLKLEQIVLSVLAVVYLDRLASGEEANNKERNSSPNPWADFYQSR